jgi:4'-phosphopantetheinyl transferase
MYLSSRQLESVPQALESNEVHIWTIDLAAGPGNSDKLLAWLSLEERERAARFHFQRDRLRWLSARAGMRQILASYLGMRPQDLVFAHNDYGKPRIDPPLPKPLYFNLSHSRDLGLLGVAGQELGIDLEYVDPACDWESLAPAVFMQQELAELFSHPASARRRLFFELWTGKEAYMKARGLGVSLPPISFSVAAGSKLLAKRTIMDPGHGDGRIWSLYSLAIAPDYPANLAYANGLPLLKNFDLKWSEIR